MAGGKVVGALTLGVEANEVHTETDQVGTRGLIDKRRSVLGNTGQFNLSRAFALIEYRRGHIQDFTVQPGIVSCLRRAISSLGKAGRRGCDSERDYERQENTFFHFHLSSTFKG